MTDEDRKIVAFLRERYFFEETDEEIYLALKDTLLYGRARLALSVDAFMVEFRRVLG